MYSSDGGRALLALGRAWPLRPAPVVGRAKHGAHRRRSGSAQRDTAHPRAPPGHAAPAIARGGERSRPEDAGDPRSFPNQVFAAAGAPSHPSLQRIQIQSLRSAMDLEHSFGPAYARGLLVRGQQCWAVIGVNAEETRRPSMACSPWEFSGWPIAGSITPAKRVCQGLKVLLPAGCGGTTRARMAWLNRELAQWELYEVGAGSEELVSIDTADQGNLKMRLVHAFNPRPRSSGRRTEWPTSCVCYPRGCSRVTDRTQRQRGRSFPVRPGICARPPGFCDRLL